MKKYAGHVCIVEEQFVCIEDIAILVKNKKINMEVERKGLDIWIAILKKDYIF